MHRDFGNRNYIRPIILELAERIQLVVSRNANLERPQPHRGSAFGLQGQKCSAASRVIVEEPVYDELIAIFKR